LEFVCEVQNDRQAPSCSVWRPDPNSQVAISLLNAPSGNGKTSFLTALHRRIQGVDSPIDFRFTPELRTDEHAAVSVIPQQASMVRHWTVGELTSGSAVSQMFLSALLPDHAGRFLTDRFRQHLGEFSGGQRYKIYTASALERLFSHRGESAFLLLDETFDGLGAVEAQRSLGAIVSVWILVTRKPLNVLLVTHLADADLERVPLTDEYDKIVGHIKSLRLTLNVEVDQEKLKRVAIRQRDDKAS
jgi:ABC-type nitrate/sulfonate/bicarbonate transport system ATPase subunit